MFLHAGVCDKRMWKDQMRAFASRHRTVAYDRRGFGETRYTAETFSHVRDLKSILDTLDLERVSLVGCSQGGRFSLDFALAYPQRVEKLVLIAPAIGGAPQTDHPPDIEALLQAAEQAEDEGDFDRVNEIEAHLWLDGPRSAMGRVQGATRELFLAMNIIPLKSASPGKDTPATDTFDRLEQIAAPTLILSGDLDFPDIQERCTILGRRIAGAHCEVMSGTAHLPNLEQPETFGRLLKAFLG